MVIVGFLRGGVLYTICRSESLQHHNIYLAFNKYCDLHAGYITVIYNQ